MKRFTSAIMTAIALTLATLAYSQDYPKKVVTIK
jgi:hypothetical protein